MTSSEISRFLRKVAAPFLYVSSKEMLDRLQALEDVSIEPKLGGRGQTFTPTVGHNP